MDRLDEAKRVNRLFGQLLVADDICALAQIELYWCIGEIERLRKIEDAAVALERAHAEFEGDAAAWAEQLGGLCDALDRNPRPKETEHAGSALERVDG